MSAERSVRSRFVGLDIGTRRIGVAMSDELAIIASPETTIVVANGPEGESRAIAEIVGIVRQSNARRVVAGLPRNMKGERGVQAEWTERFVAQLREAMREDHVSIVFFDERLTSVEAARSMAPKRAGARGKRPDQTGRTTVDARAAALILQGYLDLRRSRARGLDGQGTEP